MKNVKRIFALLVVLIMLLSMTITVSADNTKGSITVNGDGTYNGYKLLEATNALDESGNATEKFAYTLNEKYKSVLESVIGEVTESEMISYIQNLDTDGIRDFADKVYREILNSTSEITPDADFVGGTAKEVDQGYWLIADVTIFDNGATNTTYSLVMLDTAGKDEIKVDVKKDVPTVEKKVEEINDSIAAADDSTTNWADAADYDINDEINFKLTGTVDGNIGSYNKYFYSFHDTMNKMTFVEDSVKVSIDGTDYTSKFVVEWNADNKTLGVSIADLLSIKNDEDKPVVTANSKIVVEYKATLDADAVIGSTGNPNEVYLEYSNNPYDTNEGEPSTGNTPKDVVTVFTYQLVIDKVDGNITDERVLLEGAGFTLYKWNAEQEKYLAVGNEITGVTEFEFKGLDAGQYKLVETTVPAGYNKADDVEFVVESEFDNELKALVVKDIDGNSITASEENTEAKFVVTLAEGKVKTDIKNFSGSELPSTGGIGTVIFYVVGGIVFVGALILLVVKVRMKSHSDN